MDNYPMGTGGSDPYFEREDPPDERPLTPIERLAIAQAFYNAVGKMVETKNAGNLRGAVDAEMRERFEQARALGLAPKSFDVELFGQKVGTYSITTTKDEPQRTEHDLVVKDADAFAKWAIAHDMYRIDMGRVRQHFFDTGELPDGCDVKDVIVPAKQGGQVKSTTLRIQAPAVLDAIRPEIGEISYALLEGGE